MIERIQAFFARHLKRGEDQILPDAEQTHLAAACLLMELSRADHSVDERESRAIINSLMAHTGLPRDTIDELLVQAEAESGSATSVFQFTQLINDAGDEALKFSLIKAMWQVAYSDNHLHKYEEHLIRRVADLIYLPHVQFIKAKHQAQEQQAAASETADNTPPDSGDTETTPDPDPPQRTLQRESPIEVVGHRGAAGEAPENTLDGFYYAFRNGTRHFELDLQLSSDRQIVVIHDPTLERTVGNKDKVKELTAEALAAVDARQNTPPWSTPVHVPTLAEVLDVCSEADSLQLEVKTGSKYRLNILGNRLLELLHREKRFHQVIITSTNTWFLDHIRRFSDEVALGFVAAHRFPAPIKTALAHDCRWLCIDWRICNEAMIQEAHQQGLKVSAWTVNRLQDIQRLDRWGVDSVITDFPTAALTYYENLQQAPG